MSRSTSASDVRPSALAGTWYPDNPAQLARSIDAYIDQADTAPIPGKVIGVLAPHAGHRYSGAIAGHAFKPVRDLGADVVVLIGPSHYPYRGQILTTGHSAYSTPLGTIPVATDLIDALSEDVPLVAVRADQEHSVENVLPFIIRADDGMRLVPLMLVDQSLGMAEALGRALGKLLRGQKALLVASSDLSHYYPQGVANQLDAAILSEIEAFDPAGVVRAEDEGRGYACGRGAIASVLIAARELGADSARVVGYATSGDVTGDYSQVVGYGAAVFYASEQRSAAE